MLDVFYNSQYPFGGHKIPKEVTHVGDKYEVTLPKFNAKFPFVQTRVEPSFIAMTVFQFRGCKFSSPTISTEVQTACYRIPSFCHDVKHFPSIGSIIQDLLENCFDKGEISVSVLQRRVFFFRDRDIFVAGSYDNVFLDPIRR